MRLSLNHAALAVAGVLACGTAAMAAESMIAYVGLRGSYVWTEDAGSSSGGNGPYSFDQSYENGYGASIYMGWVLDDSFRLEFEGGYRHADLDSVTITAADVLTYPAIVHAVGDVVDTGGHANVGTVMGNLYYDIHLFDGPILPWVGAGLGGAFVSYDISDTVDMDFDGKDDTWAFAYQFMAGVTFPVSEGMSMSVGYKYFRTEDFTYVNSWDDQMQTNITQQSVDVGLQIHL